MTNRVPRCRSDVESASFRLKCFGLMTICSPFVTQRHGDVGGRDRTPFEPMTQPTTTLLGRARRALCNAAIVAASLGAVVTVVGLDAGAASAQSLELPVNELAPEITTAARLAVDALDAYVATGSVEDEQTLAWHRAIAARYTAQQLGYDELAMIDAWSSTTIAHQRAVLGALTQVGVPYRTNTSVENEGFDCSGLTTYAWAGAGVELFRQSGSQISQAKSLDRESAKAGDLAYYPGHVMLYLGVDDAVVHSVQTGRTVEVDTMRRGSVRFGDPTLPD
jgi:cell wall-associated NlpC family hydrolase